MSEIAAVLVGFLTSALFYKQTHGAGFPELARYVLGGLVVLVAYALLHPGDRVGLRRVWLALSIAGLGVGIARLWSLLL